MVEDNFYEKFVGREIRIVQKDGFVKKAKCIGYNERFLFLEFDDGREQAISFDSIDQIKFSEVYK